MKFRFPLFISIAIHALLIAWIIYIVPSHQEVTPIEINLGLYNLKKPGAPLKGHQVPSKPVAKSIHKSTDPEKKVQVADQNQSASTQAPTGATAATGSPSQGIGDGGEGGGVDTPLSRYVNKIRLMIEKKKHYPKRARYLGQEGTVLLRITIDKSGKNKKTKVQKAPASQILVDAAKDLVKDIGTFPPIPEDVLLQELTLDVPIVYQLED